MSEIIEVESSFYPEQCGLQPGHCSSDHKQLLTDLNVSTFVLAHFVFGKHYIILNSAL